MADRTAQERMARNEAIFRDANEQIEGAAGEHGLTRSVPFICECAEPTCMTLVRLSLADYRRIRGSSRHFVVVPGHEESLDETTLVEQHEDYAVVEKLARAGEVAEEPADG